MVGGLSARLGLRGGAAPGGPLGGLRRPASGLSGGGGLRGLAWREAAQRRRPARPRSRADASLLAARSIASSRTSSGVDGAARRWTLSPSRPIAVFVDHYRMLIVNSLWMNWPAIQSQRQFVEVALQTEAIVLNVSMEGEPQKLFTYCRGSLPGVVPVSASISIVRPRRYRPHAYYNPDIYFDQMSRKEKKRAELSVSEQSLRMDATELEAARSLTDMTFNWLSRQSEAPRLSQPIPIGRVHLRFECGPSIMDAVEGFTDLELISSFMIGAAYLQGQPRRPVMRYLPMVRPLTRPKRSTARRVREPVGARPSCQSSGAHRTRCAVVQEARTGAKIEVGRPCQEGFGMRSQWNDIRRQTRLG